MFLVVLPTVVRDFLMKFCPYAFSNLQHVDIEKSSSSAAATLHTDIQIE